MLSELSQARFVQMIIATVEPFPDKYRIGKVERGARAEEL